MNNSTIQVGVGWIKEKAGKQMISCIAGDKKAGTTLFIRDASGEEKQIDKFMVFFSDKDPSNEKQAKAPDVKLVMFEN